MNFKKLTPEEITERIQRIGGEGWVTPEDYKRFSRQSVLILEELFKFKDIGRSKKQLEDASGSQRIASRIDELRDEYEIKSSRSVAGTAIYEVIGRRWEARTKRPHCKTCACHKMQPVQQPPNQTRMPL